MMGCPGLWAVVAQCCVIEASKQRLHRVLSYYGIMPVYRLIR